MNNFKLSLVLSILLSIVSTNVFAYDVVVDGIYYNLSGTDATVTYESYDSSTRTYNSPYSGDMTIPSSFVYNDVTYNVVSIGSRAFYGCSSPLTVEISNGITTIADYAFQECTGLTSVTIPGSITSIGEGAFHRCSSLTEISIPNSVTSVGNYAFAQVHLTTMTINKSDCSTMYLWFDASSIDNIIIGPNVSSICGQIYSGLGLADIQAASIQVDENNIKYDSRNNCNAVIETATNTLVAGCKNTEIPNDVVAIGSSAFYKCKGLTTITIPNSVTSISRSAFSYCTNLSSIELPNSITTIGQGAFSRCTGLNSFTIPSKVTSIMNSTFEGCSNLSTITIPSKVTTIGENAFSQCSSLSAIEFTGTITSIGRGAFGYCTDLESIVLPEGLTTISQEAFSGCTNLISVTIPGSITSFGYDTFYQCNNLTDVIVGMETPITISYSIFPNRSNATLTVPYGCKSAYEAASYWKDFKEIVETTSVDIKIGPLGMATYCSKWDLDFSTSDNIKAYIVSAFKPSTGEIVLTRMTDVPGMTGIIVKGEADTYQVPIKNSETIVSNMLVGVVTPTVLNKEDGDYTNYILAKKNEELGFFAVTDGSTLGANKAYLPILTSKLPSASARLCLVFEDEFDGGTTTSISDLNNAKGTSAEDAKYYNLTGQRVFKPSKGLYIVNGKKIIIK